jgi:hypothetical protein
MQNWDAHLVCLEMLLILIWQAITGVLCTHYTNLTYVSPSHSTHASPCEVHTIPNPRSTSGQSQIDLLFNPGRILVDANRNLVDTISTSGLSQIVICSISTKSLFNPRSTSCRSQIDISSISVQSVFDIRSNSGLSQIGFWSIPTICVRSQIDLRSIADRLSGRSQFDLQVIPGRHLTCHRSTSG